MYHDNLTSFSYKYSSFKLISYFFQRSRAVFLGNVFSLSRVSSIGKKRKPFGGQFYFYDIFIQIVDNVERWVTNLVMKNSTHRPNNKKTTLKLFLWQYGGRDVINCVNERKHKRAQLDLKGIIFGKFHWNRPCTFGILA